MPRIGVAVAIPEPWATQLQEHRIAVGDTTATAIPTHITLVPPLDVETDVLPDVDRHLTRAACEVTAFEVHLRGTGTFRPVSPVVFVSLTEGISQCEALAAACRRGPLEVELPFPYHPHVTVAHHLADDGLDRAFAELTDFECRFPVAEFCRYEHDQTSGWRPARSFRLQRGT